MDGKGGGSERRLGFVYKTFVWGLRFRWRGVNFRNVDPEEKGRRGVANGAKHALRKALRKNV